MSSQSESAIALAMVVVAIIALLYFVHRRDKKQEATRVAEHVAQQKKDYQENIGRRIFNALEREIEKAKENGGEPRMRIDSILDNDGCYSVLVGVQSERSFTYGGPGYAGFPVLAIDIYMTDDVPYIQWKPGVYNPGSEYGVSDIEVKRVIEDSIAEIRRASKRTYA